MNDPKGYAIAIDGPVGVGKSTIAKILAQELNITYIDTGAMYRAVAYYSLMADISPEDITQHLDKINIQLTYQNGEQHVLLNGQDISQGIRTQAVANITSIIAAHEAVRLKLVAQQQAMAKTTAVVMDGRDIASKVLPWAQVKIYLDAAPEVRAKRRQLDLEAKGQPAVFETILEETKTRDHRDKTREISPLIQVPDAHYIDTGHMTLAEVVAKIKSLCTI